MILSPFRYPGSKAKMLPILMEHLDPMIRQHNKFVDVFVGGGSVLLEVAKKYPTATLYANDKDPFIYSFWQLVAGDGSKLEDLFKLVEQPVTLELFYKLREASPKNDIERAYRAIFFNRTTFSGIANSGPIGGKEQKSKYTVDCRYNAKKLKEKILQCNKLLVGRTTVDNEDFSLYDQLCINPTPAYLDPPYYIKGEALYNTFMKTEEHTLLAKILTNRQNWLLSYDDCPEIRELYKTKSVIDLAARYSINGKKNNWEHKNELLITI